MNASTSGAGTSAIGGDTDSVKSGFLFDGNQLIWRFLEISFHFILYIRGVYPATVFAKKQWKGVPVVEARSEELRGYIWEVLDTVRHEKFVKKLMLDILENNVIVERYVFELSSISPPHLQAINQAMESKIVEMLRSCLLKIGVLDSMIEPLDIRNEESRTFSVLVDVGDGTPDISGVDPHIRPGVNNNTGQPHRVGADAVAAGHADKAWVALDRDESAGLLTLIPLKNVRLPTFTMNMHILCRQDKNTSGPMSGASRASHDTSMY